VRWLATAFQYGRTGKASSHCENRRQAAALQTAAQDNLTFVYDPVMSPGVFPVMKLVIGSVLV
jgi:hypothetical protein